MKFDFSKDPFENFLESLHQAEQKSQSLGLLNFNAMTLATVDSKSEEKNKPLSRTVLFKGLRHQGFSFFTHYDGRKGESIENNKNVSVTFYWSYLNHQINISGKAHKLPAEESDVYFQSRNRLSQIGAWASDQSQKLDSRFEFEEKLKYFEEKFKNKIIPRPNEWGGYSIIPTEIEFWFAAEARLHERFVYSRLNADSEWQRFMRYP